MTDKFSTSATARGRRHLDRVPLRGRMAWSTGIEATRCRNAHPGDPLTHERSPLKCRERWN